MISDEQIHTFQTYILDWYQKHQRDLPWRNIKDPYAIMVSEMMSQQTQISRVVPKYLVWMERFPDVFALEVASTKDVLQYWSGLGYNRRALYLKKAAEEIVSKYQGKFPQNTALLQSLPGIGEYTAAAIACFAFDEQIPVIDTNVRKVIAVKFFKGNIPDKKKLEHIAMRLVPLGKAYTWNQALMDYAAEELKSHKIAIPKQSKFKDSDRYYRGQIVKLLLQEPKTSVQLQKALQLDKTRLEKVSESLVKDGVITQDQNTFYIMS